MNAIDRADGTDPDPDLYLSCPDLCLYLGTDPDLYLYLYLGPDPDLGHSVYHHHPGSDPPYPGASPSPWPPPP